MAIDIAPTFAFCMVVMRGLMNGEGGAAKYQFSRLALSRIHGLRYRHDIPTSDESYAHRCPP